MFTRRHLYNKKTSLKNQKNIKIIFGIVCIALVLIVVNSNKSNKFNKFNKFNKVEQPEQPEQPGQPGQHEQNILESNITNTCKETIKWNSWYMRSYNSRKYGDIKKLKNKKSEDSAMLILVIIYIVIIFMGAFNLYKALFIYSPLVYWIVLFTNVLLINIISKLIIKIDKKHFEKKKGNAVISLIAFFTVTATFISGLLILIF